MEVSTSSAKEQEPCELYIPVAKKARLITLFNKCIICQNDRKEKLRTAKESSIKTLLAALERRRDETYRRLVIASYLILQRVSSFHLKALGVYWKAQKSERKTWKHLFKIVLTPIKSASGNH